MKVGDKVYCIKNFKIPTNPDVFFDKNKTYKITAAMKNVYLNYDTENKISDIYQIDYKLNFHFYPVKYTISSDFCFNDYFITIKELRKLKLEKLNNI